MKTIRIAFILSLVIFAVGGWFYYKTQELASENLELKFRLALKEYSVRSYYRDPNMKTVFYFADVNNLTNTEDPSIRIYNSNNDQGYKKFGVISLNTGLPNKLYSEKLQPGQEFRIVGVDSNRLVFTITGTQNSPGPCFSPWFYGNLYSISKTITDQKAKEPYQVSEKKLNEEKGREADCLKKIQ